MAILEIANRCMYIYKIINKINGRWYIGKHNGSDPEYMGSGKLLKQAYKKYGKENFEKIILETCSSDEELNIREDYWIESTNAINDPISYNLVKGGTGGDRSKFIPYDKIDRSNYKCQGTQAWYKSLSEEEKKKKHERTAEKVAKGWYVSKVNDSVEVYVHNIAKWCQEHGVGTSVVSEMNTPGHPMYQKQIKGWRIRRSDMPLLPPYIDKRKIGHENVACKGKTWRLINGKRVWFDK